MYKVESISIYGGTMEWFFDSEDDAKRKVRELKDSGGSNHFIITIFDINKQKNKRGGKRCLIYLMSQSH